MYCPNCGKGEQQKHSYCRSCGEFLPDLEKIRARGIAAKTPEENIKTSLILSTFSSVVSILMAILLYATHLGKEDAHPIIYIAAALFTVIGIWQIFNIFASLKLKKHFEKRKQGQVENEQDFPDGNSRITNELLNEADFENVIPASITENTTTKLPDESKVPLPQTKHQQS